MATKQTITVLINLKNTGTKLLCWSNSVYLEKRGNTGGLVIIVGFNRVVNVDGVCPSLQIDGLAFVKIIREVIYIHRGRHNYYLKCDILTEHQ